MEHAFDEVYSTHGGRVTASSKKKYADGVTENVKFSVAPVGMVTDDSAFAGSAGNGVTLTQTGTTRNGAKNTKRLKDLAGIAATDAVRKFYGLESTSQQRAREERERLEKEAAEKAAAGGEGASEEGVTNRVGKELAKNGKK
jgi:hypothetical protein